MAEPAIPLEFLTPPGAAQRLPRCCTSHPDWATLSQHLFREFPDVAIDDIVREVRRAKEAVDHVRLEQVEALAIGELIARHQLLMRSGERVELARLDPERHNRAGDYPDD
jgi:hypothetical protein